MKTRGKTILIGLLAIAMLLLSQVGYFWEGEKYFIDLNNFIGSIFILLHALIIFILALGAKQKQTAFILLLIDIVLTVSYLQILWQH